MLRLAGATTARLDVVQEARPITSKLAADSGDTVNLAVLSDRSALYVDQVIRGAERAATAVGDAVLIAATQCESSPDSTSLGSTTAPVPGTLPLISSSSTAITGAVADLVNTSAR